MKRLIFGCGFLGTPAGRLWADSGDEVYGITRKSERFSGLRSIGIRPLIGNVTEPSTLMGLPCADTVLVSVGMDRSVYSDVRSVYVEGLQHILNQLPDLTGHLIFVSSTGVYENFDGQWVDENSNTNPARPGGAACLEAEELIKASRFADRFTILRFAGLYGDGRVPMKDVIANRQWEKLSPSGFLNLIHVADGSRIIQSIARQRPFGQTLLVSDGKPANRRDYYEAVAQMVGTDPIKWTDAQPLESSLRGGNDKRISNQKLVQTTGYVFRYPDYLAGLKQSAEFIEG